MLRTTVQFQSTPPVWAETGAAPVPVGRDVKFQSTPPVWAETISPGVPGVNVLNFNPLHPCGRRRFLLTSGTHRMNFNPLHPCGRRRAFYAYNIAVKRFQSTPPVWAETLSPLLASLFPNYFNPLHPCGRRLCQFAGFKIQSKISIHSTRVGGDIF